MTKRKTDTQSANDPIANANRAAEAWADADPAAAFEAAVSDACFAALCDAVKTLEQTDKPDSPWRWPGACDEHGRLDRAGMFRRRPWADAAAALYSLAHLVEMWRDGQMAPDKPGWFWKPAYRKRPDGGNGACYGAEYGQYFRHWTPAAEFPTERADAVCVRALRTTPAGGGLSALAVVRKTAPEPVEARHVVTVTDRAERIHLARMPARIDLATLSPLDVVEADGAPFVAPGPEAGLLAQYRRRPREAQRAFRFAGPRTLDGAVVGDPVIRALASLPLTGDERSPIRGDVSRLATLAYAATGPMRIPEETGALMFGAATEANRKRFWNAALVFDGLMLRDERTGRYVTLGRAPANGRVVNLSAPFWWKGKGEGAAWRLTGGLFRRLSGERGAGGAGAFYSGLERTIAGIEAYLSYGPSAGRGKHGRIPDALRPVRPGGPGPQQWIPWRLLLVLAGEPVPADTTAQSTWGRRYRRRVAALIEAGYPVPANGGAAKAGDTVEIVRVHSGGKHRGESGLYVRASARFCAARADQVWTRLPAARVFGGE